MSYLTPFRLLSHDVKVVSCMTPAGFLRSAETPGGSSVETQSWKTCQEPKVQSQKSIIFLKNEKVESMKLHRNSQKLKAKVVFFQLLFSFLSRLSSWKVWIKYWIKSIIITDKFEDCWYSSTFSKVQACIIV